MIRDEDLISSVDYSEGQKRAAHRVLVELVNRSLGNTLLYKLFVIELVKVIFCKKGKGMNKMSEKWGCTMMCPKSEISERVCVHFYVYCVNIIFG